MKKKEKRCITLIEMMIVMFLIALITGVIAYNYRGVLDEGKAFKTQTAMNKLETILNLAIAENPDIMDNFEGNWLKAVERSPLVKNAREITRDGWGRAFDVSLEDGKVIIRSERYEEYLRNHPESPYKQE